MGYHTYKGAADGGSPARDKRLIRRNKPLYFEESGAVYFFCQDISSC